ncbi:fasciclin-like arabinogalactan protein 12 [Corylus avellana]|uniref:fasciclin-like arabinogalactan protein 12 n=1 Tax=Corylus avellana TaxID=13451 RepID=UPI00286BB92B|nr:fasciclin-like arabinogalactan protein 12 [Corylus avellana]XP_059431123.1 fasciclin-like arabinogalactan protein 12 [Corylus avellana]
MAKQAMSSLSILLVFLFHCITTSAQPAAAPTKPADTPAPPANPPAQPASPPAQPALPPVQPAAKAPAPAQPALVPVQTGATDVTKILGKAHGYSVFVRLLKSTGVAKQLYGQLNNSNNGFTIFAPTDSAFSNLKAGTINSLSDLQKTQLLQFHILNTVVTLSNFQTLSNPVPTEAGDAGAFPMNITTAGNQVNISTGLVNATLGNTVYSDDQLVIYQVTKVLLPLDIFNPKPKKVTAALAPVVAPTSSKPKPTKEDAPVTPSAAAKVDAAAAVSLSRHGMLESIGVAVVAFFVIKRA